jgi:hypothetical protein
MQQIQDYSNFHLTPFYATRKIFVQGKELSHSTVAQRLSCGRS